MVSFDPDALDVAGSALAVVVGGANTDIAGFPDHRLAMRDSNPGHVRLSPGGVGRNIAENLARLGVDSQLITAFGGDADARELADECTRLGIGLTGSLIARELPGARYIAINDEHGDLALALNDMRVMDLITPAYLATDTCADLLAAADVVVVDANLAADTLEHLARTVTAPILLDPVSAPKAVRTRAILERLAAIKPNALEAAALLGREVRHADDAIEAARALVEKGTERAYVTLGATGVAWAGDGGSGWLPATRIEIASTSGAGDAFAAGVAYAMLARADACESALFGAALAALTLSTEVTVNPALSRERLRATMRELWE